MTSNKARGRAKPEPKNPRPAQALTSDEVQALIRATNKGATGRATIFRQHGGAQI